MKYFTPELLAQCRSSDDDLAEHAADRWEQALAAYNTRLERIRSSLPLGARQLLKNTELHDAECLTIKTLDSAGGKELFLTFRLARSNGKSAGGVELRYNLSGRTTMLVDGAIEPVNGARATYVLYHEFDLTPKRDVKVFTHALLLTSGLEFRIRFSNMRFRWFGHIWLANSKPSEIAKEWADDDLLVTA